VEELVDSPGDGGWKVIVRDWSNDGRGKVKEERWDAVVLATCWYDAPVFPTTEGIEDAKKQGLVKHSKWWKGPKGYEGKVRHIVALRAI
jgi:cation diffusion facilitator CzcD-associated flavoprotein CzcO